MAQNLSRTVDNVQLDIKDYVKTIFDVLLRVHQAPDVSVIGDARSSAMEIVERYKAVSSSIENLKGIEKSEIHQIEEIQELQRLLLEKQQNVQRLEREMRETHCRLEERILQACSKVHFLNRVLTLWFSLLQELSDEVLGLFSAEM
jgi:hypothetical protein